MKQVISINKSKMCFIRTTRWGFWKEKWEEAGSMKELRKSWGINYKINPNH